MANNSQAYINWTRPLSVVVSLCSGIAMNVGFNDQKDLRLLL
jgi:hypothetical protein